MSKNVKAKGISFIPSNNVSAEAREKLEGLMKRKNDNLNKLVEKYRAGDLVPQN